MLDLPDIEERQKLKIYGKNKARYYKNSNARLFIESSFFEAKEICLLSGKDVYCVATNTVITPDTLHLLKNNPKGLKKYIPVSIKKTLRPVLIYLKVYKKSSGLKNSFKPTHQSKEKNAK